VNWALLESESWWEKIGANNHSQVLCQSPRI